MIRRLVLAVALLALAACVTGGDKLQEAVSLMASLQQHGEGADVAEATASLDELTTAAPNDPYVLKVAALSRMSLADNAGDRATRVKLRQDALALLDRAIANAKPGAPPKSVTLNGQQTDIELSDLKDLRAGLAHQNETDR